MQCPCQSQNSHRGIRTQNSVREWLKTHEVDAKPEHAIEATSAPLKRNASSEDDLALGIEASLYGKQGLRTVQEYLRSIRSRPAFSRWNSLTSAFSAQSAPLSVMDVLNLWSDDPEEVLFDLGFGCDEPDISGRIPARFINNQSSARGINIQVFLDAQKNRMDIENPDVSNRFRQLEVLQQVTTAFTSLVGVPSKDSRAESGAPALLSAEARERRKRMGMLLRRASRKTLSQNQLQTKNQTLLQTQTKTPTQDCTTSTAQTSLVQPHEIPAGFPERLTPLKRARQSLPDSCLSSLLEEQGPVSEASGPTLVTQKAQDRSLRLGLGREPLPMMASGVPTRKKMPPEAKESFEMEEIQSFDEGSVSGYTGVSDTTAICVMRTNSCQSDSSGFLEEPLIPSFTHHPSLGPELMKAFTCLSRGSTESQITVTEDSLDPPTPIILTSSSTPLISLDPASLSMKLSSTSLDPSSPSLDSSFPYRNPSSTSLDPSSPSINPSSPSLDPSSPSINPLSHSIPICPPKCALDRAETTGLTTRHSPLSTCHDPLEMTNCFSGAKPSLMEETVTEEDGFSSQYGAPCHKPDSLSRHLVIIMKTETEMEHSEVVSEEAVPTRGKKNTGENQSDSVQTETKGVGDQDTETKGVGNRDTETKGVGDQDSETKGFGDWDTETKGVGDQDTDTKGFGDQDTETRGVGEQDTETKGVGDQDSETKGFGDRDTETKGVCDQDTETKGVGDQDSETKGVGDQDTETKGVGNQDIETKGVGDQDKEIKGVGDQDLETKAVDDQDTETKGVGDQDTETKGVGDQDIETKGVGDQDTETKGVGDQDKEIKGVGDQDTDSSGSHEGSSMDFKWILKNTGVKMEMEIDNKNCLGSDGPMLAFVDIPQRIDQRSNCGSVPDQPSEDPLLRSYRKPSEPAWLNLSTDPSLASCPTAVHRTTVSSETSEGLTTLLVKATVPPAHQQIDLSTDSLADIPSRQSLTLPLGQVSSPSSSLASAFPAVSSSVPNKTPQSSSLSNDSLSGLTSKPAPSPVPHIPAAQSVTHPLSPSSCQSQNSPPVLPRRGTLRSGRSVSVQMPSCLSSVSCSAFRSSDTISPVSPSVESCPQTELTCHARRSSVSRKVWSEGHTCHFSEPQNTVDSMERARVTPETMSVQSPCPSPPLSASSQALSHDRSRRPACFWMKSPSLDAGLWQEDWGQEVYDEEEDGRWEKTLFSGLSCPCSCHNPCRCCSHNNRLKDTSASDFPFSQDELEGMMRCIRKFRSVLADMEEQLSDNQASVFSSLSDTDREEAEEILELRRAVKKEAGVLEQQLTELAHHYDDNFKMKMHRLLDEQSHLYTQLKLPTLTPMTSSALSHASSKNVATQCCLLPWLPLKDMSDSISIGQVLEYGLSDTKPDKLDFVGFIQRLKESLRHSGNAESVE
ncbi:hypothetical protein UPYG_G00075640 [Umbra pygmaea]|uniref:ITPR-interacting domain-containing protein n=1 Tax=Umbra pygmaea TaxID=75934 RepID=A0ABD0XSC1_UMBPY